MVGDGVLNGRVGAGRRLLAAVVVLLALVAGASVVLVPSPAAADRAGVQQALPDGVSVVAVMSADEATVQAGQTVHLHASVINNGKVTLHALSVSLGDIAGCPVTPFDLRVGGVSLVNCAYRTTAADVGARSFVASVSALELPEPVSSNAAVVQVVAATPSLTVISSADEPWVVAGSAIHLHVTVVNTGTIPVHGVTVAPADAPDCAVAPFDLSTGALRTVDCSRVTAADDGGPWTYTASVTATELTVPVVADPLEVGVDTQEPSATAVASADEAQISPGSPIHLHVQVTNTGNLTLHGTTVTLPGATGCTPPSLDLALGASRRVDCTVATSTTSVGPLAPVATVTANELRAPVTSNAAVVQVADVPAATIVATADTPAVVAGEPVALHVQVVNTGNVDLHAVTIADEIVPSCVVDPFDLAVGASRAIECSYDTTSADIGTWSYAPSVSADEVPAPVTAAPLLVEVVAPAPALFLVLTSADTTIAAGETAHLHLAAINTGNVALHGVTFGSDDVSECSLGPAPLAVGEQAELACTQVMGGDPGTWTAGATAAADELATPIIADPVSIEVVTRAPGLGAVLAAEETSVLVGVRIHLHLTVVNTGNVVLHDVTVTDASVPECEAAPFDLGLGDSRTIDCAHVAQAADVGTWSTSAVVTAMELASPVATQPVTVAVASRTGAVTGTITDSVTGAPVEGALVTVLSPANFALAGVAATDADGHYSVRARIGAYFVYVVDPTGDHNATFFGDPTSVAISPDGTTAVDEVMVPTRGAFAGQVTDSETGDPLDGVVVVGIDGETDEPSPGATTDASGTYHVADLPAGSNRAMFVDLSGGHASEYFDDSRSAAGSDPILISGGATTGAIDAGLDRQTAALATGTIAGTVTGVGGQPLAGVAVVALDAADFRVEVGQVTDASGTFDLPVAPGAHKLTYYDTTGAYQQSWWDGRPYTDAGVADPIVTGDGGQATADASLESVTGAVAGTVVDAGSDASVAGVAVVVIKANGLVAGTTTTGADGAYVLGGLRPGGYRVRFVDPEDRYTSAYHGGGSDFARAAAVTVAAGEVTGGVDGALDAVVDSEGLLREATLLLRADSVQSWNGSSWANEGTGGAGLDAHRLADAVTFLPGDDPNGPGFRIPSQGPGGRDSDDGFSVPGAGALADDMGASFTVTLAFTPLYPDAPTMRFLRKYAGTDIVASGSGFVIENTPLTGGLMATTTSAPGVGVGLYPGVPMVPGRQVITIRLDRDEQRFTVFRNGVVLHDEGTVDLGDVTNPADLTIGPGQVVHDVAWHSRALTDAEVRGLDQAL